MALVAVALIFPAALWLAYLFSRKEWKGKVWCEAVVMIPLVVPPVATGLILLWIGGRRGWVGNFFYRFFHIDLAFNWPAVVIASGFMAFPLVVRAIRSAFDEVNPRYEAIAATLGGNKWSIFWRVTFPLARHGIISGFLLGFARALGEFGATVIFAGNIPGRTTTLSLSIYQAIQLGQDERALKLAGIAFLLALLSLGVSQALLRRSES